MSDDAPSQPTPPRGRGFPRTPPRRSDDPDPQPWVAPGATGPAALSSPPTGEHPPGGPGAFDLDEPYDQRRRRRLIIAGVIAVMILISGSVGYVATRGSGSETAARSPTTERPTTTEDPSAPVPDTGPTTSEPDEAPTTTEPLEIDEEAFLALIRDLQSEVEQARQLTFLEDVVVELEDGAAFEARLFERFEEEVEDFETAEVFYRALGLLDTEESLIDLLRGIYGQGVLGFYDSETKELVVRGTEPTPYVQKTIVHELVHALDDQHVDLRREHYDDRKDEIRFGFTSVVEGNAVRVEEDWLDRQSREFQAEAAREEADFVAAMDLDDFPEILLHQISAPYVYGLSLVTGLVRDGGERRVDAALVDPPETSEQVLFPDKYEAREPAIEVPIPPADGDVVDDGAFGALMLLLILTESSSTVNELDAFRAVDGWGGDWYVTWQDGDANCIRADFVGDTDRDTADIRTALDTWTHGRGIGQVSEADDRVRLESCTIGSGGAPRV